MDPLEKEPAETSSTCPAEPEIPAEKEVPYLTDDFTLSGGCCGG